MKLKFSTILFLLLITCNFSNAQKTSGDKKNGKIGISFSSFGESDVIRFEDLDGAASYNSDSFYTLGINYIHPLNNWLEIETGLEYSNHTISIQPNLPPDMDDSPYNADFSLLNIPLTLRANFLTYFFINGGLMLDLDTSNSKSIDRQTGIGGLLGIAAKYDFDFGATVFINPYLKAHSLILFSPENHPQRLMEFGFRFGITFDLKKRN